MRICIASGAVGAVVLSTAASSLGSPDFDGSFVGGGIDTTVTERQDGRLEQIIAEFVGAVPEAIESTRQLVERDRVDILTPYCLGMDEGDGNGYMACFQMERELCAEDGSQYVIRAFYLNSDPGITHRYGAPFCSDPAEPVVTDPAIGEAEAPPMPVVTMEDFRRLDIAPSQIESDSGGFGLIRANTNFYATEEPQTLETTMLGQAVAIQAVPVRWTWDYGDGSEPLSNSFPGGPQREFNQETTTSHAYQDTGEFSVSLTTSYRGQFQVNGGPWIAIPGMAEVPSDPVVADIWRSKSKNVAEDCVENPEGWACGDPFVED